MRTWPKWFLLCTFGLASLSLLQAGDLPKVPENVRELMQDRKFAEAAAAIDTLLAADDRPANPDYLIYLKGRALHLNGKHREALDAFARIERDFADSPWIRRARFGQAAALLKLGDFEAAEHIYEEEVKHQLSPGRKHEIASIYLEFADSYFQPPRTGAPGERAPDYQKALNFYNQALAVGPNQDRRLEVEFRVARCHQELGKHAEAANAYRAFLVAHPKSKLDVEARYQLGVAELAQGQAVAARRTWKDLLDAYADKPAAELKDQVGAPADPEQNRLAQAAYRIAHTYGIPGRSSKEDLELGVAAAERFIASFPDLALAAQSALEVAQAYLHHNRLDDAATALKKLIENPKYREAKVLPDARSLLGFTYQRQKKFNDAIAAWQEYLARHPAHSSWAQVQQAIIDTEFLSAVEVRRAAADSQHADRRDNAKPEAADDDQADIPADLRDTVAMYAHARRLWEAFLAKYPLDSRAPAIMLEFGLMNHELAQRIADKHNGDGLPAPAQRFFEAAIADWTQLVGKYPKTEESSRGQFLIAATYEEKFAKFAEALENYRKLNWGAFAPRAQERIGRLTRQELAIATERAFRTGQQPRVKVTTRNIRQLTIKAYRVDLETYFRKMHLASGIESLDISLIDPERSWTFEIPNYAEHKEIISRVDVALDAPGVMAVTVANEPRPGEPAPSGITVRPQEATTMVLRSDLDILVKCSRNELFVFAENMRTGKPFAGAKLLVSDGAKIFAEGTTNADGVFIGAVSDQDKTWDPLKTSNDIRVFAAAQTAAAANKANDKDDSNDQDAGAAPPDAATHFASNVIGLKGVDFAQGISAKGYIYTERPSYRPGQLVHVRGIVRWIKADEYFFEPGKKFKLDVYDSRGRQIRTEQVALGDFGSFATRFLLPPEAAQGDYRLHVHDPAEPDKHNYQGTFAVQEYQLQSVHIEIDTPKKVYLRGEEVTGTIKLRYYYGAPVADREIRYQLPDGTVHTATTDAAGEVAFKFETREFREDQILPVRVLYPELNLASDLNLFLATRGFQASLRTVRDVFLSGETFDVIVDTKDPAGKKTGQKLTLTVLERTEVQGKTGERATQEHPFATDKDSGEARVTVKIPAAGKYVLRASGTDQFGNPVSADHTVTVSGDDDSVRLRILSDRHLYKAGDTAAVQVHWREAPALALVTYQGARVLGYRLVQLEQGANRLEIPMTEQLAPNFDLTVSVMTDSGRMPAGGVAVPSFHEASSPFDVERPLVLALKPSRDRARPGDDLEVAIRATDPQGNPVRAELSLGMVEKSLLDLFGDRAGPIAEFFQGTRRSSALRTAASCTFQYAPQTRAISATLIAEANRAAVEAMERASRADDELAAGGRARRPPMTPIAEHEAALGEALQSVFDAEEQVDMGAAGFSRAGQQQRSLGRPASPARRGTELRSGVVSGRALPQQLEELEQRRDGSDKAALKSNFDLSAGDDFAFGIPELHVADPGNARKSLGGWGVHRFDRYSLRDLALQLKQAPGAAETANLGMLWHDGTLNYFKAGKWVDATDQPPAGTTVSLLAELVTRETGYWNPHVVTDEQGQATVTITLPHRSTAWKLEARGITTATLTGQAGAELMAKKDLFAEMKLPAAFVDGDSAQILATIHNDLVAKGSIEVVLKSTIGGKTREDKRTLNVEQLGTRELTFDREIAGPGEATFELAVRSPNDDVLDTSRAVVPVRPYGLPVLSTTGGSASSDITAWISPPPGMAVRNPSLEIVIGPSVERSLLDVVLGSGASASSKRPFERILCESPLERTTSDLIAAVGLIKLLGGTRDEGTPEAADLANRVRSTVGYLVSAQNDDGGWHWAAARGAKEGASDRAISARALWALTAARDAGFSVPDEPFAQAITFVQSAFTSARENDYDGKAMLLHALSTAGRGDFAYANRLYRSRQSLSPAAIAYLSLAFVELERNEIAREMLDLLGAKLDAGPQPAGDAARIAPSGRSRWTDTEVRALYLVALNAVTPNDPKVRELADGLIADRAGGRWHPERATGPAVLGLADYFSRSRFAGEHYTLKVFVNDNEVAVLDIQGGSGSRVITVPSEILQRGEKLPEKEFPGDARKQRVNFELAGRGRFTFNCTLSGFVAADQLKNTTQDWQVTRHYEPAPLELDGHEIPRGFDLLTGSFTTWRNPVTELPVGQRAQVSIHLARHRRGAQAEEPAEYLIVTEPIPSGCSVLEKSITGNFDRYEITPGEITFFVGDRAQPGEIRFDLYGYTAGKCRTAPTIVRSYYEPDRMMVTQPRALQILAAGQKSKDEYKLTPRELYELGKRLLARAKAADVNKVPAADRGNGAPQPPTQDFAQAGEHLTQLFDKFNLQPDYYKEVAQMLLDVSLQQGKAPAIVRYFEVIKEKYPDLEIPFEQIVKVGAAYRDLNEYERSYLIFRATAEGSFARESEIGGFLESQGEFERSIAVMDRILREYPAEPYIASATYALAQRVYGAAPNAAKDPKLREKQITKIDLIRDAIRRLDDFLTVWPDDPAADQASFSLASALVELENWPQAIERANRYAERFPKSTYLDSFWYIIGYSHFARGEHQQALDMCRRVADATRVDPATGRELESQNKWRAIYIRGQVFHSLSEPGNAIAEYRRVADQFMDAKETIEYFTRKAIELPEITTVRPPQPDDAGDERPATPTVPLKFRNVAACEVKVYRIDLLKFGLLERDLANITKINLAGIRPLHDARVELGDGMDYRDRTQPLELPLKDEGAYLVVCRGEDLHTSGLVLVTPLTIDVQEEQSSGRVRVTVKNTVDDKYAADVLVKVIGSRNDKFQDGQTDLRGIFVADGIQGRSTIIARADDGEYAFHRGQLELGPPPAPADAKSKAAAGAEEAPAAAAPEPAPQKDELIRGLIEGNRMIQESKGKELQDLYEKKQKGIPAQQAF